MRFSDKPKSNDENIPQDEKIFMLMVFKEIEEEWDLGTIKLDDVRVRLSKVYSIVQHPRSKAVVLKLYDGLEKVKE